MLAQEQEWIRAVIGLSFTVLRHTVCPSLDGQQVEPRITAACLEPEAGELLAFPLLYTLAFLSFNEARPYGDEQDKAYSPSDYLTLPAFLQTLSYEQGHLIGYCDTLKGRRVYTELCLTPQGQFSIHAFGRGLGAEFWLRGLAGEAAFRIVPPASCGKAKLKRG